MLYHSTWKGEVIFKKIYLFDLLALYLCLLPQIRQVKKFNVVYDWWQSKFKFLRYILKCSGKHDTDIATTWKIRLSVFPATFHVISRKIDFFWDSVQRNQPSYSNNARISRPNKLEVFMESLELPNHLNSKFWTKLEV